MEEETPPVNRPFRIRRPSSSIISSTTPSNNVFAAPSAPQRSGVMRRDLDDDVQPSSSSTSSFPPPSSARGGRFRNPPSPLGSPDSTFWSAPSPVSYRGPATPGGVCAVSSSTADDSFNEEALIPQPLPVEPDPPSPLDVPSSSFSPLRSKIKKASSFERFSAQQLASAAPQPQLPPPPPPPPIPIELPTSPAPGPSRLMWEGQNGRNSNNISSGSSTSHIKIPSKKLAAKLASVFEQQEQQQAFRLSEAINEQNQQQQVPLALQPPSVSSIVQQGSQQFSQQQHQQLIAEENESLMRELSESPLNLTDNSSSNGANGPGGILRNPTVISQSTRNKKIPLTPKQKLLQRIQSAGELLSPLSPPPHSPPSSVVVQQQQLPQLPDNLQNNLSNNGVVLHSPPPQQLEYGSYEALLRPPRDDFVQDLKGVESGDPNVSVLYDADAYSYYYGNILADEIFSSSSGGGSSSRQLLLMNQSTSALQEAVDSLQGHQVLQGHPHGHLEFVLGLNGEDPGHEGERRDDQEPPHPQFLEQNEAQRADNISTLRNLLMMEPLRTHDDSWITSADYQRMRGNNMSLNSWVGEWPRQWQHGQEEQDEVMDMSVMDGSDKSNKRGNQSHMEEEDLSGLPLLNSMQMPLDLQQLKGLDRLEHAGMEEQNNPVDLHHHYRPIPIDVDEEPVNLMSVNLESDLQHNQLLESPKQASYCLSITTAPSSNNDNFPIEIQNDNIDERRLIRVKKNKETSMDPLVPPPKNQVEQAEQPNFIPDKPVQPKSFASLPTPLNLVRMGNGGWAVFTNRNKTIPANTRFGPVEGPLKKAYAEDLESTNAIYPCLVMVDSSNILWQLDRTDDELCNWMKFVRLGKSAKEQNGIISENEGLLYFTTCKEIPPKTELLVGYGFDYAARYGLPFHPQQSQVAPSAQPDSEAQSPTSSSNEKILLSGDLPNIEAYLCFECDTDYPTVEDLNDHLDKDHKDEEERRPKKKKIVNNPIAVVSSSSAKENVERKTFLCTFCGDTFSSLVLLKKHGEMEHATLRETRNNVNEEERVEEEEPPVKVKCVLCYKTFATKDRLERHMIVHSDDESKPLKCNSCPKRFLTNSALAGHVKTHAEEGKCFECPMCEFSTQQLLQLKEHVQTHKNRENGLFHCPRCSKKFVMYSMVRKHIRAFHGPRQFGCDTCPMSFPTSDKLKLHRLKHSDHREFLCAECGRQFKRKDKLREHMKRMHENKKKTIEITLSLKEKNVKKFIPKVSPEEFERFMYKCGDCMLGFKRRGMLVNHLAKRHPDKPPQAVPELNMPILRPTRNYFCPYCERVYKSSSKRKGHILKGHPGQAVPPQLRGKDLNSGEKSVRSVSERQSNRISEKEKDDMKVNEIRRETIVGKVHANPHACTWCHRQYATRAKLLQHQRKSHLHLMPVDIQMPRTQKNNVVRNEQSNEVISLSVSNEATSVITIPTTGSSTITTITTTNSPPESEEGSVIGYLLTTATVGANGELSNLIPGELVMLPVPSHLQSPSSQNSLQQSVNNVISNLNVVNPILTQND